MGAKMQNQIVGTWLLQQFLIEDTEGKQRNWGTNCHGLLIYASSGHMSVSINKDIESKSDKETQNNFDSILFYSGTYSFENEVIKHHVTEASSPSRIGKEMLRYTNLENNILTLTSPKESFGHAILKWKKIV